MHRRQHEPMDCITSFFWKALAALRQNSSSRTFGTSTDLRKSTNARWTTAITAAIKTAMQITTRTREPKRYCDCMFSMNGEGCSWWYEHHTSRKKRHIDHEIWHWPCHLTYQQHSLRMTMRVRSCNECQALHERRWVAQEMQRIKEIWIR